MHAFDSIFAAQMCSAVGDQCFAQELPAPRYCLRSPVRAALDARAGFELHGIPSSLLNAAAIHHAYAVIRQGYRRGYTSAPTARNDPLRYVWHIRIRNSSVYVETEVPRVKRFARWLHGLSVLLHTYGKIPDVDFVFDANDTPNCDATDVYGRFTRAPAFAVNKRRGSGCVLVPDASILQPAYFANTSAYSYMTLRRFSQNAPFKTRERAMWFDIMEGTARPGNNKYWRTAFRRWIISTQPMLNGTKLPVHMSFEKVKQASKGCEHQFFACAEGQGWTMRHKNILLCGSLAVWFRTPAQAARPFIEYWDSFIQPGKHFVLVTDAAQLAALPLNASEMAEQAEALVSQVLHPKVVVEYLRMLLMKFSAMQVTSRRMRVRGTPDMANFVRVSLPPVVRLEAE